MGHYRSEMGFEDEDEKRARDKARTRKATAEYIYKRIAEEGIEYVLADIILDSQMASIHYRVFD